MRLADGKKTKTSISQKELIFMGVQRQNFKFISRKVWENQNISFSRLSLPIFTFSRRYMREPELRIGYQLIINDPREGGQLTIN